MRLTVREPDEPAERIGDALTNAEACACLPFIRLSLWSYKKLERFKNRVTLVSGSNISGYTGQLGTLCRAT